MKNIDDLILNSLKLINYDRSKHITEQSALKKPISPIKLQTPFGLNTYSGIPGLDQYNIDFTKNVKFPQLQKPGKEDSDNENDLPYVTLKSVVNNQDIYLPQKNIILDKKTKKTLSIIGQKVLKKVSSSEPYNQEIAEGYFGSQCLKLSGRHPKYDAGYFSRLDYYIDNSGVQCAPIPYKVVTQQVTKKGQKPTTVETEVFQIDLPKPVTLKNGNTIQKSKFKYPSGCKPISYDFCLRFSWQNLHAVGSQDSGSLEFEQTFSDPNLSTGSAGGFENVTQTKKTYRGCVSDEWFPWTNSFIGYLDKNEIKVSTDSAGVKQYTKCIRSGYSNTGVNLMEDYLKSYNLQSGVGTLNPISYDKTLKFPLSEAIKKATGEDFKIKANYIKYTIDLNQWFTFGADDYKNYNTNVNTNFQDYVNSVESKKDIYSKYLEDLYGLETKDESGKTLTDKEVGIQGLEDMLNKEKTLSGLNTKYEDMRAKNADDPIGYLTKLSDDYNAEKKKPKPNDVVTSFIENEWNSILMQSSFAANQIYNTLTNSSLKTDDFTIMYLAKVFGVVDNNNKDIQFIVTGKQQIDDFFGGLGHIFKNEKNQNMLGTGVLKPEVLDQKIWGEVSKYPLMIPNDYNQGGINTKNIKPVTLLDANTRGKSEGIKNGFLYQIQDVTNDSGSSVVMTEFLYKNIKVSTAEVESDSGKGGEMSEEELEKLVKSWEHYDQMISDVITKTIVMVGR